MLDNVLNKYKSMAAAWASVFTTHATILFGALAAISLIWTFGQMALRRADLGEFASEQSVSPSSAASSGGCSSTARRSALAIIEGCARWVRRHPACLTTSRHRVLSILVSTFSAKPMKNFR
jgi:hypothetical protein